MAERYVVVMAAGTLREAGGSTMTHEHIPDGISVRCEETGTHALHMTVAGTVLGRVWTGAAERGKPVHGALVRAEGSIDRDGDDNVGVEYSVAVDSAMLPEDVDALVRSIDPVADLPDSLLDGIAVRRIGHA